MPSAPNRAEVVRGVDRMLDALIHEAHPSAVATGPLVSMFNELLQQARDQFRDSEMLRLIDALDPGASISQVVVRLSLVKRAIDAQVGPATERPGPTNRRRWPRYAVTWPVALMLADAEPIATRAVDVSLYGIRLAIGRELAARLRPSGTYRFEVHVPEREARFAREGEICYIGEDCIGLRTLEALPEAIIMAPQSGAPRVSSPPGAGPAAAPRRFDRVRSLLSLLRWRAMFRTM